MEKIRDRIRKLLRLARDKGASENEAANAMAMASRLMLQHNIEHVGDEEEDDPVVKGNWMHVERGELWEIKIASGVGRLYNCRHAFARKLGSHYFVGRADNIAAAEETFPWVCEQVEELYKEGLKAFRGEMGRLSKADRADFRKSFKEACAKRVYYRIAEIISANRGTIPEHRALVVIDQSLAKADDLMKNVKKRTVALRSTGAGTGAGWAAGEAVKIQDNLKGERQ